MARKIFWGVLSLIVLYVCVALLNFSSSTKLNDALRDMGGDTMPVGPFAQEMIKFFNKNKRWPTSTEIVLPKPPAGGIVHSVKLEPDGVVALKLRGLIWLQRTQVRVAIIPQPGPEQFGWTSACMQVTPEAIAGVVYSHCGRTPWADVRQARQESMDVQEKSLEAKSRDRVEAPQY